MAKGEHILGGCSRTTQIEIEHTALIINIAGTVIN